MKSFLWKARKLKIESDQLRFDKNMIPKYCHLVGIRRFAILRIPSIPPLQGSSCTPLHPHISRMFKREIHFASTYPWDSDRKLEIPKVELPEVKEAQKKFSEGRISEAEFLLQRASDILQPALGQNNPLVQNIADSIFSIQLLQGKFSSSEQLALQTAKSLEKDLEKQNEESIKFHIHTLEKVVFSYFRQFKLDEALGFCGSIVQVCKPREKWFLSLASALNQMGCIYVNKGRDYYGEGELCFLQAIKMLNELEKDPSLHKSTILNNLGGICHLLDDKTKAKELYNVAMEMANKTKQESIEIQEIKADILRNLGEVHMDSREFKEAEKVLEQSLEHYDKFIDSNSSPKLASTLLVLATVFDQQNNSIYAEGIYKKCIQILERLKGQSIETNQRIEVDLQKAYKNFGTLLKSRGRTVEAQQLLDKLEQKA